MQFLKQSTAATLKIGPFVDSGDGNTVEDGLTISQADVRLSKNGGNMTQKNESTSCTHDELGYYDCPVDTTDTGTLGRLKVMVHESGALPVVHEYMVVTANVYDSLCSTDLLQVDQREVGGVALGAFIATGTVSGYSSATSVTLATGQNIRKGSIIVATANTGIGGAAVVNSYTSGTGVTVLESPGFPAALDNTTTYIAFAGPNLTAIPMDASGYPEANMKYINDVEITGDGSGTPFGVA
jgi:hypothetical protein